MKKTTALKEHKAPVIENLMLDLNGIFHPCAQEIYKYGEFKAPVSLLHGKQISCATGGTMETKMLFFKKVCSVIDHLVEFTGVTKRLILCVDGVAPLAKQAQQAKRRYLSSLERAENEDSSFDSNAITPGSMLMDQLCKYVKFHIRKMASECDLWKDLEIIFSSEKAPGEGEHKLLTFLRKYGSDEESYCIYGMDADLIMLALGTHIQKMYILRDDPKAIHYDYHFIDIGSVRNDLSEMLDFTPPPIRKNGTKTPHTVQKYRPSSGIEDFIFMCFLVGNDFLPNIPGIEIIEGGIDIMINVYKTVCEEHGHLTMNSPRGVVFRKSAVSIFLSILSEFEQESLAQKMSHQEDFFPDPILKACTTTEERKDGTEKVSVDIIRYRNLYYKEHVPGVILSKMATEYLIGMQWVLTYYTKGIPNWKWKYPYHYAPFAHTLAEFTPSFKFPVWKPSAPTSQYVQLLSVLPLKSSHLLPYPLDNVLTKVPRAKNVTVDVSGKRFQWEATVNLELPKTSEVEALFKEAEKDLSESDILRNVKEKSIRFVRRSEPYEYSSFYGNFSCWAKEIAIEL